MTTLLALTVGGSCAPLVTAIREYKPDHVLFLVSRLSRPMVDGPGAPCRTGDTAAPSIIAQTSLPEGSYSIFQMEHPDDLAESYREVKSELARQCTLRTGWRRIADYTGGTKTMSAALVLAALESAWELSLVVGHRPDLVRVANGTELASVLSTAEVYASQVLAEAEGLFDDYAYRAAERLLERLLAETALAPATREHIVGLVGLCRGFDAWDRFDHSRARSLLEPYQSRIVPQWISLKALTHESAQGQFARVLDLMRNAERRAARGRYDDAIARLYRALELLAQARLGQLGHDPSDLNVDNLPAELRPEYDRRRRANLDGTRERVRLGLVEDYDLLLELEDPLGQTFHEARSAILDALDKRNASILAHGTQPLLQADYDSMLRVVEQFIERGLKALGVRVQAPQFPKISAVQGTGP